MKRITHKDLEKILGFEFNSELKNKIDSFELEYRELTTEERDNYILNFVDVLTSPIVSSGEHRILEWEKGWSENLENFRQTKNIEDLIPKYHGKNRIVKWMGEPVMPITENFDYKIHICFVDAVLQKFLNNDIKNVFEFGCGPAYHLVRLKEFNNSINLNGSDWITASQNIINEINDVLDTNINCFNFNFFKPDFSIDIPENSAIYTIAALEQIGDNFEKMIEFLMVKKPDLCIHMEPIDELLDSSKIIDFLSIKYFRKRNYLNKFLPYLENLEKENKIEILVKKRIYSGSYFTEGHSLIVWKIKK